MATDLTEAPRATGTGAPVPAGRDRWPTSAVGVAVGALVALWLTRGVWGGRPPGGGDVTAHLVRTDFGIAHLVTEGRLDGWFPRFSVGHQEFLLNGPGLTWLLALVRGLTFGQLSGAGALKVVAIGALAAQPLAVAYLGRSFGLDRRAAAVAGILSLAVSSPFGGGLAGTFDTGLVPHQVGVLLWCVALGAILRTAAGPTAGRVAAAVVATVALMVTHLLSVLVLAVMVPLALGLRVAVRGRTAWRPRGLAALGLAGGIGVALAGWWLLPVIAHRDLRGPVATWAVPPFGSRLAELARGELLFERWTVVAIVLGALVVAGRSARSGGHGMDLVLLPIAYLLLAHVVHWAFGPTDLTVQLPNRGLGYAGILATFPLALLLGDLSRRLRGPTGLAVATAAAVGIVLLPVGLLARPARQLPEPIPAMRQAASELARVVPDGARFAMARDFPAEIVVLGIREPARWMAWASGRDALNVFNPEASPAAGASFTADGPAEGEEADRWVERLARLGVTHVVVHEPNLRADLVDAPNARLVWVREPLTIFRVEVPEGTPPSSLLDVRDPAAIATLERLGPEHLRIELSLPAPATTSVAISWSPKWRARIDGDPVRLRPTSDGLLGVDLPGGEHHLELRYGPDRWDRAGVGLSAVTVGALGGVWAWRRSRRRATSRRGKEV